MERRLELGVVCEWSWCSELYFKKYE